MNNILEILLNTIFRKYVSVSHGLNNVFNSQRFIFPSFKFDQFLDPIDVPGGEISWKLLHETYDKEEKLPANMKKASKLSHKVMHPGDNKQ